MQVLISIASDPLILDKAFWDKIEDAFTRTNAITRGDVHSKTKGLAVFESIVSVMESHYPEAHALLFKAVVKHGEKKVLALIQKHYE